MTTTLHFDLKYHFQHLAEDCRWNVLTYLILHANSHNRCWPTIGSIAVHATNGNRQIAIRAKKWLIEHGAIKLVPYAERQKHDKPAQDETRLAVSRHIYQLTGVVKIASDNGIVEFPYLYQNPDSSGAELSNDLDDSSGAELSQPPESSPGELSSGESSPEHTQSTSIFEGSPGKKLIAPSNDSAMPTASPAESEHKKADSTETIAIDKVVVKPGVKGVATKRLKPQGEETEQDAWERAVREQRAKTGDECTWTGEVDNERMLLVELLRRDPTKAPAKRETVPAADFRPMVAAIATAFGWKTEYATPNEMGKLRAAARQLCLAGVHPTRVQVLFDDCMEKLDHFGPNALPNRVSDLRARGVVLERAITTADNGGQPAPEGQNSKGSFQPNYFIDQMPPRIRDKYLANNPAIAEQWRRQHQQQGAD